MKTGLSLYRKYRKTIAWVNLISFTIRKYLIGFDVANHFLQRVDKVSLQLILRKYGAQIGNSCDIESGLIFHNCKDYSNLIIGDNCHIGKNCFFDLRGKIIIHSNVVISMKVSIITHQDLNKSDLKIIYPAVVGNVEIHKNCYIGVNATILKGVCIHPNSILAAGSLVLSSVQANTIVGGIPSNFIKNINTEPKTQI
jgi:acetyltransferase-like isoleucine patch superfamily enzyme